MPATITISGVGKTGSLAKISVYLLRTGFTVIEHQFVESDSGAKLLNISIDAPQIDKDKLAVDIKNLDPDYEVVNVALKGSQRSAQSQSVLIKEIASQFPNIAPLVQAYAESFGVDTRNKELFDLGKKIGAFIYAKEWSLGNPLKMPVALKRALFPALEKFGKAVEGDTSISFPSSPFCGVGNQIICCEFLTGFSQGFLDAGPLTKNTQVIKVKCRAKGDALCTYSIDYTV